GEPEGEDGRVRRVHLAVDRRVRQVVGQERGGGVDGRLHLLLGDVQREVEVQLQRDDGRSGRAGRGHLLEPWHLAELALERRGDRGGHHVGTGARIERLHLHGRVVHLGRGGGGRVGAEAGQDDRGGEERGGDRPQDERPRRVHFPVRGAAGRSRTVRAVRGAAL